jgi:predicted nucleic acid-binding protein
VRFTLDSNILVRAVASPRGPTLRLLDNILSAHTLVLPRFILDEVERVLLYPRLQARYQIAASEAARFTGNLADVAHMVEPVIVRPLLLSDPADDPVLYTAADGKPMSSAPGTFGTSRLPRFSPFVEPVVSAL